MGELVVVEWGRRMANRKTRAGYGGAAPSRNYQRHLAHRTNHMRMAARGLVVGDIPAARPTESSLVL